MLQNVGSCTLAVTTLSMMKGSKLKQVTTEKDIGVHISSLLKPSEHCRISAQTARGVLGQILSSFMYRDKVVFKNLYTTYVRPHLEFAWSPWLAKDINALEEVQEKIVKNVTGLHGQTYVEKLAEMGSMSLKNKTNIY